MRRVLPALMMTEAGLPCLLFLPGLFPDHLFL
jgi:hypothetical protein